MPWNREAARAWMEAARPRSRERLPPEELELFRTSYVLPVGEFCEAWMLLQDLGVRRATLPFDYLGACSPAAVLESLRAFRADPGASLPEAFAPRLPEARNDLGMQFAALLPAGATAEDLARVRETCARRVRRLRDQLAEEERPVLVVHSCAADPEDQSPVADLESVLDELRVFWAPLAPTVTAFSFRPRDAARRPDVWASGRHAPDGARDGVPRVRVRYTDLPPHDPSQRARGDSSGELSCWLDRMPAHRAALYALCGYRQPRTAHGDPRGRFPWQLFADAESDLRVPASETPESAVS